MVCTSALGYQRRRRKDSGLARGRASSMHSFSLDRVTKTPAVFDMKKSFCSTSSSAAPPTGGGSERPPPTGGGGGGRHRQAAVARGHRSRWAVAPRRSSLAGNDAAPLVTAAMAYPLEQTIVRCPTTSSPSATCGRGVPRRWHGKTRRPRPTPRGRRGPRASASSSASRIFEEGLPAAARMLPPARSPPRHPAHRPTVALAGGHLCRLVLADRLPPPPRPPSADDGGGATSHGRHGGARREAGAARARATGRALRCLRQDHRASSKNKIQARLLERARARSSSAASLPQVFAPARPMAEPRPADASCIVTRRRHSSRVGRRPRRSLRSNERGERGLRGGGLSGRCDAMRRRRRAARVAGSAPSAPFQPREENNVLNCRSPRAVKPQTSSNQLYCTLYRTALC